MSSFHNIFAVGYATSVEGPVGTSFKQRKIPKG